MACGPGVVLVIRVAYDAAAAAGPVRHAWRPLPVPTHQKLLCAPS